MKLTKAISLCFLSLLFVNTQAQVLSRPLEKESKLLPGLKDFKIDLATSYKELKGPIDKATIFSTTATLASSIDIAHELYLHSKLNFTHESGSTRAKFDETRYAPTSKFTASYAYLGYDILDLIKLEAGSLDNSNELATSKLIAQGPTALGLREEINFENEYLKLSANATQSRPSNDELSERLDRDQTGTPRFFSEFINVEFKIFDHKFGLKGGQFAYENLSSTTAFSDKFVGNTVLGLDEATAVYAYKFKGRTLEASGNIKLIDNMNLLFNMGLSKNNKADSESKDANFASIESLIKFEDLDLSLKATRFEMESDATVAYYNDSEFKNDYSGNIYEIRFQSSSNLETKFSLIERNVLNESIYLSDEKIFKFSLRKTYDLF